MTDKIEQEKDELIVQSMEDNEDDPYSWVKPKIEYPVRPWVRYWAKQLDFSLAGIPLGGLAAFLVSVLPAFSGIVFVIIILPICAIVEALLLSTWGYTPGKWLLKVKVRTEAGNRLTFLEALKRSFSVIYHGMGLGIPIISMITSFKSFERLIDNGFTKWDEAGSFTVTHDRIGIVRIICFIAAFATLVYVMAIGI